MIRRIPIAAISLAASSAVLAMLPVAPGQAGSLEPTGLPFTATLSNATPLVFGMQADAAAQALGVPLTYVKGRPGDEIYLAIREIGGNGFFPRKDRLFLQFRKGRLTGWKADWGQNWMWE